MVLEIVPRFNWGALPNKKNLTSMIMPVNYVFCSFTRRIFDPEIRGKFAPRAGAPIIDCIEAMQSLQQYDMRRLPDIRFNFVIAPDGHVYKGRGWTIAPTIPDSYYLYRRKCLYIGYMGDFTETPPSDDIFRLKKELLEFGITNGILTESFTETYIKHDFWKKLLNKLLTYP